MSFYGSVYYQLIDAFSNIAFNNSNNDSDIPTTSDISKDIEDIEAKGRTSALLLKGANKWIQIKSDPDNRIPKALSSFLWLSNSLSLYSFNIGCMKDNSSLVYFSFVDKDSAKSMQLSRLFLIVFLLILNESKSII